MSGKLKKSVPSWGTDLARLDAHVIQASEYDELPELTDDMFARGVVKRAGRPVATDPRQQVTIRLPASVLAGFRATGAGWQTRMAEALKDWLKSHSAA